MSELSTVYCASCNEPGHLRRTSRNCRLNPLNQNIENVQMEEVQPPYCTSYNESGHLRRTSRLCRLNPSNQNNDQSTNIQSSVNIAKNSDAVPSV